MQIKAVSVAGHPFPTFNGMYTHDSTHDGWPVLKNANGRYCYRYSDGDQWLLTDEFNPSSSVCSACIAAQEGPLPVGARAWRIADGKGGWMDGGCMLTVTPLVRNPSYMLCTRIGD